LHSKILVNWEKIGLIYLTSIIHNFFPFTPNPHFRFDQLQSMTPLTKKACGAFLIARGHHENCTHVLLVSWLVQATPDGHIHCKFGTQRVHGDRTDRCKYTWSRASGGPPSFCISAHDFIWIKEMFNKNVLRKSKQDLFWGHHYKMAYTQNSRHCSTLRK